MNAAQRYTQRRQRERRLYWFTVAGLLILGLLTALAHGQCDGGVCPPPSNWQPPASSPTARQVQVGAAISGAVCRVVNQAQSASSIGSGALVRVVDKSAYVLTCDHLFHNGVGRVTVRFGIRPPLLAEVVKRDSQNDLALLKTTAPSAAPLEFSAETPTGWATAIGLGGDARLRAVRGRLVGVSRPVGARYPSQMIDGAVRPGDSGGPVVNDQGRLIGVVWGVRGDVTYATTGQPIVDLMASLPKADDRLIAWKPPTLDPNKSGRCDCNGQCVQREELGAYARRSELDAATQQASQQWSDLNSRMIQLTNPQPATGQENRAPLQGSLAVLFAALGVGGPVGLAWALIQLLCRRRAGERRGLGGPRRDRFPADKPAAEPPRSR